MRRWLIGGILGLVLCGALWWGVSQTRDYQQFVGAVAEAWQIDHPQMVPIDESRWFPESIVVPISVAEAKPRFPQCPVNIAPDALAQKLAKNECSVIFHSQGLYRFFGWQQPAHQRQVQEELFGVVGDILKRHGAGWGYEATPEMLNALAKFVPAKGQSTAERDKSKDWLAWYGDDTGGEFAETEMAHVDWLQARPSASACAPVDHFTGASGCSTILYSVKNQRVYFYHWRLPKLGNPDAGAKVSIREVVQQLQKAQGQQFYQVVDQPSEYEIVSTDWLLDDHAELPYDLDRAEPLGKPCSNGQSTQCSAILIGHHGTFVLYRFVNWRVPKWQGSVSGREARDLGEHLVRHLTEKFGDLYLQPVDTSSRPSL